MTTTLAALSARLPCDRRYVDTLTLRLTPAGRVQIQVLSALPGLSNDPSVEVRDERVAVDLDIAPDAASVLAALKPILADDRYNFKQYGRPSKALLWGGGGVGVSLGAVRKALEWAAGR
jgi:hypothetical protein